MKQSLKVLLVVLLMKGISLGSFSIEARADGFYDNAKGSPLISLIQMAQREIDIEIYQMTDINVLNALRAALKKGVKLKIVQEPAPFEQTCRIFDPTPSSDPSCSVQKQFVQDATHAGAVYVPFSKALCGLGSDCFEHGKMVIVDQRVAMLSTGNFNATNLCDVSQSPGQCNRDFSYVVSNPKVVKALLQVFENDLLQKPYNLRALLSGSGVANQVTISPFSMAPLLAFIQLAKSSILIENQYITDPTLAQALIQAAKRGVKVYLMVSSLCSFGTPKEADLQRVTPIFEAFAQAGVNVRLFSDRILVNGRPGYLHAKAIMVDQKYAWMGSVNGSTTALNSNREFGIFFGTAKDVYNMASIMTSDFNSPGSETFEESAHCSKDVYVSHAAH